MPAGLPDSFSPGKGLEIRGLHRRRRNSAIPTVQLINTSDATPVPLLVFDTTDIRLLCSIPTPGFDGSCYSKVIPPKGGDQRTGQYSQFLALVP